MSPPKSAKSSTAFLLIDFISLANSLLPLSEAKSIVWSIKTLLPFLSVSSAASCRDSEPTEAKVLSPELAPNEIQLNGSETNSKAKSDNKLPVS